MLLQNLNYQILQYLNSFPVLDSLMIFIIWFGSYPLWIVLTLLLYYRESKKTLMRYILVLIIVSSIVFILKTFFMIPRPKDVRVVLQVSGYSMPSAHAALSFASAMFFHPIAGRFKYGLWILSILVSISRVSLGVHYPSDIIVGGFIGCIAGYIGFYLKNKGSVETLF